MNEPDLMLPELTAKPSGRRTFLTRLTAAGLSVGLLGVSTHAGAASMMKLGLTE